MGQIIEHMLLGKSILVVDDEPKIQHIIGKYLERAKISDKRIVFASNGQEALQKMRNQDFGLVIMDIVMPKANGLQVIKALKKESRTRNIPLLLISGNLHAELVKIAVVLGVKNILAKPFTYDHFMQRVCDALKITV